LKPINIKKAVAEARRFLSAVDALDKAAPERFAKDRHHIPLDGLPKESGAVRRASMDLTRALAEMRK